MGYVYFAWLLGLLVGWAFMNVLVKLHPTRFAFMMSLVVVIAWVLYYFVDIKLTNYNTKPVSEQLGQIVDVMKRHLVLFPGILLQGASISALLPILPTYATKVVGVSTIEYTIAIGRCRLCFSMLFYLRLLIKIVRLYVCSYFYRFYTIHSVYLRFIFSNKYPYRLDCSNIYRFNVWILLPAWNTFMAGQIDPAEQEETWGVFNSVQGFGSMIGPLFGGLIAHFLMV